MLRVLRGIISRMENEPDQPQRDAYWQKDAGRDNYVLWVDGAKQATVDPARNAGEVYRDDLVHTDEFMVPDYVSIFDEAERRLGSPRVDDVRGADGKPDPELRRSIELTAELDREARTPAQWVRAYAQRAFDLLDRQDTEREVSLDENEARNELASALSEPGDGVLSDEPKLRAHLEAARALLAQGHKSGSEKKAGLQFCDKAIATLDYEDARALFATAHQEEALARGALSPELAGSAWSPENAQPAVAQDVAAERSDDSGDRRFLPSRAGRSSERAQDRESGRVADDFGRER
jgi:hypothetical protein